MNCEVCFRILIGLVTQRPRNHIHDLDANLHPTPHTNVWRIEGILVLLLFVSEKLLDPWQRIRRLEVCGIERGQRVRRSAPFRNPSVK